MTRLLRDRVRLLAGLAPVLATLGLPCAAVAHDEWSNGEPVPSWVKRVCCGVADAHHLQPEQVHVTPEGYRVDGYAQAIPERRKEPSPDGSWWVFYRNYPDGSQSGVFCFFGPESGV